MLTRERVTNFQSSVLSDILKLLENWTIRLFLFKTFLHIYDYLIFN